MKLFGVITLVLFSLNAFAGTDHEFNTKLLSTLKSRQYKTSNVDLKQLSSAQYKALWKAAEEESNIWGDTILEGDYSLDPLGRIELAKVQLIIGANSELLAYRIVFQHAAYDTSSCQIDWDGIGRDDKKLKQQLVSKCEAGVISAGAYVSPDYRSHFRDEANIEDFTK